MHYPKGEAVHEKVPSQLLKIDELMSWMEDKGFNGVLTGETRSQLTEIFITNGSVRNAILTHGNEQLVGKEAIEAMMVDSATGNLILSLFSLKPEICKPLLIPLIAKPHLSHMSSQVIHLVKLMESCLVSGVISHIVLENNDLEGHILFNDGVLVGSYTNRQPKIDSEFKDFYSLYHDIGGTLSVTQIKNEEFEKIELPLLEIITKPSETEFVKKILVSFLNFTRDAYGRNGLPPQETMDLFKRIAGTIAESPVVIVDNEFLPTSTLLKKEQIISEFSNLLRQVHTALKDMWGPKVVSSRYRRIYENYLKEKKDVKPATEILDSISPEKLGL
ncbi:hypothetical protein GX441_09715 [bacterium]|nr:hypothetical protein [bacterium]